MRELIRRGEERLSHSKSVLERLKSAEAQTTRLLNAEKNRVARKSPQHYR